MNTKKFTLATKEGSRRLFALFLILILAFSFVARMIASDAGQVKISRVRIDARGASIDTELYYPAWTKDSDSLPAVIVTHGGGVTNGNVRGFAEELARRGFVVLNVNSYGVGTSEQPRYDEGGQGEAEMFYKKSPGGMIDALDFLRTLKFVDQTRIGMAGHSAGSRRSAYAAMMDCGWLTLNDIMINELADVFGQEFTEEEINMNADELAAARLNEDQLAYYNALKAQNEEHYNTRIKAVCLVGSNANLITPLKTVTVGGYEVQRNCQVNFGIVTGTFDYNYKGYIDTPSTLESWHTDSTLQLENWYIIDDVANTSTIVGNIYENDVTTNDALRTAIDNRQTRIISFNEETHSKNFFSKEATTDLVKYFEQTLSYNCGELMDKGTVRLDASNSVFIIRECFNLLAMISMVLMCVALASMLLKTNYFAACVAEAKPLPTLSKGRKIFLGIGAVVVGFAANYAANLINGPLLSKMPGGRFMPYFMSWWITVLFVLYVAIGCLILIAIMWLADRKKEGGFSIAALNVKMKLASIGKTILLGTILLAAAYFSLALIEYLFGQDYRFWMASLGEMKVELWRYIWRLALMMLPCFVVIGIAQNYTTSLELPEWQDTLIAVVINSVGLYLLCGMNLASLHLNDTMFSTFISTYGYLLFVPINVYITRKMYKLTNSVWLGATFNSLILSWSLNTAIGLSCEVYFGQTWFSNFFNI